MKTDKAIDFPDQDEIGPEMKGADALVASLEREGVDVVYAYPGGASMELHQALTKSEKIRTILLALSKVGALWHMGMHVLLVKPASAWRPLAPAQLISSPVLQMHTWTAFR